MIWRYLLAIVLSVLVIFLWQLRHRGRAPENVERPQQNPSSVEATPESVPTPTVAPIELTWGPHRIEAARVPTLPEASIDFLRTVDAAPLGIAVRAGEAEGAEGWERRTIDDFAIEDIPGGRVLRAEVLDGIRVEIVVTVPRVGATTRDLGVQVRFENSSGESRRIEYVLFGATGLRTDSPDLDGSDISWVVGRTEGDGIAVAAAPIASLEAAGPREIPRAAWVGAYNGRCLAALYPDQRQSATAATALVWREPFVESFGGITTALRMTAADVEPGATRTDSFGFYIGPRDRQSLAAYEKLSLDEVNGVDVELGPHYRLRVDTGDGSVSGFFLEGFGREVNEEGDVVPADYRLLLEPISGPATLNLEVFEEQMRGDRREEVALGFAGRPWAVLPGKEGEHALSLQCRAEGLVVTKTIRYEAPQAGDAREPWHLDVAIKIENTGEQLRQVFYQLYGPCAIDSESIRGPGSDIRLGVGHWNRGRVAVNTLAPKDIAESGWDRVQGIAWVGLTNSYFATILLPEGKEGEKAPFIDRAFATALPDPEQFEALAAKRGLDVHQLSAEAAREIADDAYKNIRTAFTTSLVPLAPRTSFEHRYEWFAAPREDEFFEAYENLGFGGINDYGSLHILVSLFIGLLGFLHTIAFGSWGVAIILLTFLVKLCLHPLNRRSQRAMMRSQKKMQVLKPAMDEIKQRYANDRLAMQREMSRLFREHNFNPAQQLGGCLIMFLQLPVWLGLYTTLGYATGLRHAQFLWIDDLTLPDRLFTFDHPVLWVSSFNLLPILYVILTVINQRMQPRPTDPQLETQYKMMTFMLIFFGVIFYGFPAGFMLYIMTSAALGIFESKLIKAQIAKDPEPLTPAPVPAAPSPRSARPAPTGRDGGRSESFRERKKRRRR